MAGIEKKLEINETQIMNMAQQEQQTLMQREDLFQRLADSLRDTIGAIEALEGIQEQKGKMLVKLGAGVLIEATITATTVKRSFAENGYLEEDISTAIKNLEKRKANIEVQATKVAKEIQAGQQRMAQISGILQQMEAEKAKNFSVSSKK